MQGLCLRGRGSTGRGPGGSQSLPSSQEELRGSGGQQDQAAQAGLVTT